MMMVRAGQALRSCTSCKTAMCAMSWWWSPAGMEASCWAQPGSCTSPTLQEGFWSRGATCNSPGLWPLPTPLLTWLPWRSHHHLVTKKQRWPQPPCHAHTQLLAVCIENHADFFKTRIYTTSSRSLIHNLCVSSCFQLFPL